MRNHPRPAGATQRITSKQLPSFGTGVVLVGSRGLFGDLRVLPVSRMAREHWRAESDVVSAIRAEGADLMTAEAFFQLIEDQRQKLLSGSTDTLPILPELQERWRS